MAAVIAIGLILLIFSGTVRMSPISVADQNELENLFFMNEQEEESLERNSVNNSVIEKVKTRILNSLHMKEAPKIRIPPPSLMMFQNSSWSIPATSPQRNGKSIFLQSEIAPNTCFDKKGPHCIRFQISLEGLGVQKSKMPAEIWLYKKEGVTQFNMRLLTLNKETFQISNLSPSSGWIRLDATFLLTRVSSILDLEAYSETSFPLEMGIDKNPILIVFSSERSKRSTGDCERSCCVKNVYVSFKEIGWDSWIVQPEGYSANICKGTCENRMDLADKHHTTIMILMMAKAKRNMPEIAESIRCSPKGYKPLSIIYTDESGVKVISNLPNMSVSECSCS